MAKQKTYVYKLPNGVVLCESTDDSIKFTDLFPSLKGLKGVSKLKDSEEQEDGN